MAAFYLEMFGVSLALTLIVEIGLAALFKIKGKRLIIVALVNTLTNPVAVFLSYYFEFGWIGILILETTAVVIEGLIYYLFGKKDGFEIRRPFLISLVLNVASYGIGVLLNFLIGKIL